MRKSRIENRHPSTLIPRRIFSLCFSSPLLFFVAQIQSSIPGTPDTPALFPHHGTRLHVIVGNVSSGFSSLDDSRETVDTHALLGVKYAKRVFAQRNEERVIPRGKKTRPYGSYRIAMTSTEACRRRGAARSRLLVVRCDCRSVGLSTSTAADPNSSKGSNIIQLEPPNKKCTRKKLRLVPSRNI